MTDTPPPPIPAPSRFQFGWAPQIFFRPRAVFEKIAAQNRSVWLTPLLILTVTALLAVAVSGWLKSQAALTNGPTLPEGFEYYTPEQQASYLQTAQATQGPVFVYVLPGLVAVIGVWLGWLLVGGLLHLVATLLGGRGDNTAALNLAAWASLPLALRDLLRAGYMLAVHRVIASASLSGFAPQGEGGWALFLASILALVDLFVIWRLVLLAVGLRSLTNLTVGKAIGGALVTILIILLLQALLGFGIASLGGLTVTRPFGF
jgi:hypothetical protein